jgi:hypothetical protein
VTFNCPCSTAAKAIDDASRGMESAVKVQGASSAFAMEVDLMEATVQSRGAFQLAIGSHGFDAAGVDQNDPVGNLNRRQIM